MRSRFPGYYQRTDDELSRIWEDGILVLDANVLLNLYRYSEGTRKELLGVLRRINDRLWIPHQVAEEFHSNRQTVIRAQRNAYSAVRKSLADARKDVEKKMGEMHTDPGIIEAKDLRKQVEGAFEKLINEAQKLESDAAIQSIKPTNSPDDDEIWKAVMEVVGTRVGKGLLPERMQEVLDSGLRRYESRVPPGYKDNSKPGDDKFGDLILWTEIIDNARETQKPVLFVTDDRKDDWWSELGDTEVPRPELGNEIYREAGVLFHMLLPLTFVNWAGKKLDQEISETAAEEIEGLRPFEGDQAGSGLESILDERHVQGWDRSRPVSQRLTELNDARWVELEMLLDELDQVRSHRRSLEERLREIQETEPFNALDRNRSRIQRANIETQIAEMLLDERRLDDMGRQRLNRLKETQMRDSR